MICFAVRDSNPHNLGVYCVTAPLVLYYLDMVRLPVDILLLQPPQGHSSQHQHLKFSPLRRLILNGIQPANPV